MNTFVDRLVLASTPLSQRRHRVSDLEKSRSQTVWLRFKVFLSGYFIYIIIWFEVDDDLAFLPASGDGVV